MAGHPFWDWVRNQPLERRQELLGLLLQAKVQLLIQGVKWFLRSAHWWL